MLVAAFQLPGLLAVGGGEGELRLLVGADAQEQELVVDGEEGFGVVGGQGEFALEEEAPQAEAGVPGVDVAAGEAEVEFEAGGGLGRGAVVGVLGGGEGGDRRLSETHFHDARLPPQRELDK